MVNNAGITRDATMRTMTEDQFDQVISVHLKGTWNGTRLAAAIMRERKSGAIVNISSLSGKVGMVGQTNYSAAKAGIVGLSKAAAKELAHHGVRVGLHREHQAAHPLGDDRGDAAEGVGSEDVRDPDATGRGGPGGRLSGAVPGQ
jgi:NAD(P)-dependent dehydrogenase (short-subunit alcohol dehydrogenase family)